ncbi:MAG TPA: cupin domain-containing protein [Acidobacteria bacterium]|nr:cupin domain-containing protein [Acidobacteriota bacterium]
MRIRRLSEHTVEGSDPKTFTGQATLVRLNDLSDDPVVNAYRVAFQPRARTDWHTHSGTQLLIILDGVCRLQTDAGAVTEITAGDVVSIEPGERHWHGASAKGPMTHLAVNVASTTSWFEKVTDDEYDALLP